MGQEASTCCASVDSIRKQSGLSLGQAAFGEDEGESATRLLGCHPCDCTSGRDVLEFEVTVDKTRGHSLGIDIDCSDPEHLRVDDVYDGLVGEWNALHPKSAVRAGDIIKQVNDVAYSQASMVLECKRNAILRIRVQRAKRTQARGCGELPWGATAGKRDDEFEVLLDKSTGSGLGIGVEQIAGSGLVVESIGPGLVAEWNRRHGQDTVQVGDLIIDVNGVGADMGAMVEECKRNARLRCRLRRSNVASSAWSFAEEVVQ